METCIDNNTTLDLDDLDLTHCVVGPDLVARLDGSITLFRRRGRRVEMLGVFDGPVSALMALDALDAADDLKAGDGTLRCAPGFTHYESGGTRPVIPLAQVPRGRR
jgi:hypothetical protein